MFVASHATERPSMKEASIIGLDLAKRSFQAHGALADGSVAFHLGMMRAAPFPCLGQIAPKIKAEAVRWSVGALGRVPRLGHRRGVLFFLPMRASAADTDL